MPSPAKYTYEKRVECASRLRELLSDGKTHKWKDVRRILGIGPAHVRATPFYDKELVSFTSNGKDGGLKWVVWCSEEEIDHFRNSMKSRSREILDRMDAVTNTWMMVQDYTEEE